MEKAPFLVIFMNSYSLQTLNDVKMPHVWEHNKKSYIKYVQEKQQG